MRKHDARTPDSDLTPVPVAVLLPRATGRHLPGSEPATGDPTAHHAGLLIATYTRVGDRIVDLDRDPALAWAADCLDRHLINAIPTSPRQRAALICAGLPRPNQDDSLAALSEWMRDARNGLTDDGFLLVTVAVDGIDGRYTDRATTVITAARAAGLIYHQHLIAVHTALSETAPPPADIVESTFSTHRQVEGRHIRAHSDLFIFAAGPGGDRA